MKTLFPEAFPEGTVNSKVHKQLLGGAVEQREKIFADEMEENTAIDVKRYFLFG